MVKNEKEIYCHSHFYTKNNIKTLLIIKLHFGLNDILKYIYYLNDI